MVPYISGFLIEGGPNQDLPNVPVRPGNALPGGPPGHIDNSLPPPPGIWPPPTEVWPPIALPPGYPMPPGSIWPPVHPPYPSHGLPGGPPGGIASNPIAPGGEQPDAGLPPTPGHPGNALPSPLYMVAVVGGSAASGWRVMGWTVVDPSLSVGMPLPGGPPGGIASNPIAPGGERPGHGLPPAPARPGGGPAPTPEPKR